VACSRWSLAAQNAPTISCPNHFRINNCELSQRLNVEHLCPRHAGGLADGLKLWHGELVEKLCQPGLCKRGLALARLDVRAIALRALKVRDAKWSAAPRPSGLGATNPSALARRSEPHLTSHRRGAIGENAAPTGVLSPATISAHLMGHVCMAREHQRMRADSNAQLRNSDETSLIPIFILMPAPVTIERNAERDINVSEDEPNQKTLKAMAGREAADREAEIERTACDDDNRSLR
jgi:hypothetical protein